MAMSIHFTSQERLLFFLFHPEKGPTPHMSERHYSLVSMFESRSLYFSNLGSADRTYTDPESAKSVPQEYRIMNRKLENMLAPPFVAILSQFLL